MLSVISDMRLLILTAIAIGTVCDATLIPSFLTSSESSDNEPFFGLFSLLKGSTWSKCPALLKPALCVKSRYRTLDGTCNNLQNPIWGSANNRYARLLPPRYGDGISSPTTSVTGQDLPNSRSVAFLVFEEERNPDQLFTIANMQWGQFMAHDMSFTAGATQSSKHRTRCCTDDGKLIANGSHVTCYPIRVLKNDPVYSQTQVECLSFVRTLTDRHNKCPVDKLQSNKPAEQMTVVTGYMDLSMVYGNSEKENRPLRAFIDGRMLVENRGGNEYPPHDPNAKATCDVQSQQETCYLGGDGRLNQSPGLTILQILLLREHNRIADHLQSINPQDDETIFQEARKINIAQYQYISYYEWLPIFLGRQNMLENHLIYQTTNGSFVNDYNPNIDASVINSHATAAYRYFHTQIEGRLELISESRTPVGLLRLSDFFNKPAILESTNYFDFLSRGMTTTPAESTDINYDVETERFLFRRERKFGSSLRSMDIQRNRDHGLASYNDFRQFCGLKRATAWEDYLDLLDQGDINHLKSLYASHEDVDLTVAGSLEAHVTDTLAGPTFICILNKQFYRTRVGDRHFFERGDADTAFTSKQLAEIRKASMARLFCDNGNNIQQMQRSAFLRISPKNKVVPCSQLPEVDLSLWRRAS